MDLREVEHAAAQRHPWEVARLAFFSSLLKDHLNQRDRGLKHLDVGAGDAWFIRKLLDEQTGIRHAVAWDIGYAEQESASKIRQKAAPVKLTATQPAEQFDIVTLLDVLEHVERPETMLRQIVEKNVGPESYVLISVPAWHSLYTHHDELLGHHKRYSSIAGRDLVSAANLEIILSGGLFHSLIAPRLLTLASETLFGRDEKACVAMRWDKGAALTGAIAAALRIDNAVSRILSRGGVNLPGLSWWALCRKPR